MARFGPAPLNLTGQRFGRLVATELLLGLAGEDPLWRCVCDCGEVRFVRRTSLRSGRSLSCGCLQRELARGKARTHGRTDTPEYHAWAAMIQRCENRKHHNYRYYGARGIVVCDRWRRSFKDFFADVGLRPSALHSLDRYPDNDGNYEPGNVRWATRSEQARNQRRLSTRVPHIVT